MNQPLKVLIVDDEASQRSGLAAMVSAWGMTPETAGDGNEALPKLTDFPADVILTDLNMPGMDGFGFLQRLRESGDMPPTIVLTAYGNIETAVKTVHELGAYWFLEKPIQPGSLEVLIRRAGSHAGLRAEKRNLERQLSYKGSLGELVGTSPQDAGDFCAAAAGRTQQSLRADHRRERHRQRAGGAHAPRAEPAPAGAVRRHQLRGAAGDADRKRTVRPREGLLHGRLRTAGGLLRSGAARHAAAG